MLLLLLLLLLLLFLRVLLLLLLLVVVQVATELIVAFLPTPKNRHTGGGGVKPLEQIPMICALRKPKPRYVRCFLPLVAKITVFTQRYAVFTLLQDIVSICKNNKNTVFYDVFASCAHPKIVQK